MILDLEEPEVKIIKYSCKKGNPGQNGTEINLVFNRSFFKAGDCITYDLMNGLQLYLKELYYNKAKAVIMCTDLKTAFFDRKYLKGGTTYIKIGRGI